MKVNAVEFLNHIEKASVGGLVNEIVLGNHLSFAVTDETKSVVVICSKGIVKDTTEEIGIFNLGMFRGAIQYAKDKLFPKSEEIEMNVVDNRLVFKNKGEEFKFLLSNSKVISTAVENPDEVLKKIGATDATLVVLDSDSIGKIVKAIQLIVPEKCEFRVDTGKVKIMIGKEVEHNAVVNLGTGKGKGKFKLVVKPDCLLKVLSVLPAGADITLEIRDGMPLIIDLENYTFLVASMEGND